VPAGPSALHRLAGARASVAPEEMVTLASEPARWHGSSSTCRRNIDGGAIAQAGGRRAEGEDAGATLVIVVREPESLSPPSVRVPFAAPLLATSKGRGFRSTSRAENHAVNTVRG